MSLGPGARSTPRLPHLLASKGYLLIVSSGFASSPGPAVSAYAASKAAVESLGRTLMRIELAHHGVAVGVLLHVPGHPDGRCDRSKPSRDARTSGDAAADQAHLPAGQGGQGDRRRHRPASVTHHLPGLLRLGLLLRGFFGPRTDGAAMKAMPEVERIAQEQAGNEWPTADSLVRPRRRRTSEGPSTGTNPHRDQGFSFVANPAARTTRLLVRRGSTLGERSRELRSARDPLALPCRADYGFLIAEARRV